MNSNSPFVFMPTNSVSVFRSFPVPHSTKTACLVEVDLTFFKNYIEYTNGRINDISVNAWIFNLLRDNITDLLNLSGLKYRLMFSDLKNDLGNVLSVNVLDDINIDNTQVLSKDISVAKGTFNRERLKTKGLIDKKSSSPTTLPLPDRRLFVFKYMNLIYKGLKNSRKRTVNLFKRPLRGGCINQKPDFVVDVSISNKMEKRFIQNGNFVERTVYPVTIVMDKCLLWGVSEKFFCNALERYMEHNIMFFPEAV